MLSGMIRTTERALTPYIVPRAPADRARPSLSYVLAAHEAELGVVEALLQSLPMGVALVDESGHEVYANPAARALLAHDVPALKRAAAQVVATGRQRREEQLESRAAGGGTRRWLDATLVPVRDMRGDVAAVLVTMTDATSRVQVTEWQPVIETLARL